MPRQRQVAITIITGQIVQAEPSEAMLVVTTEGRQIGMAVPYDCKIRLNGQPAELDELQSGQWATIAFDGEAHGLTAQEIFVNLLDD